MSCEHAKTCVLKGQGDAFNSGTMICIGPGVLLNSKTITKPVGGNSAFYSGSGGFCEAICEKVSGAAEKHGDASRKF